MVRVQVFVEPIAENRLQIEGTLGSPAGKPSKTCSRCEAASASVRVIDVNFYRESFGLPPARSGMSMYVSWAADQAEVGLSASRFIREKARKRYALSSNHLISERTTEALA